MSDLLWRTSIKGHRIALAGKVLHDLDRAKVVEKHCIWTSYGSRSWIFLDVARRSVVVLNDV